MHTPITIALIGPECSSKTTLSQKLATHYQSPLLPEYARTYLSPNPSQSTLQDVHNIAQTQATQTQQFIAKHQHSTHPFLFLDTEYFVLQIWYEYVYNTCPLTLLNQLAANNLIQAYILCKPLTQWHNDGMRSYPNPQEREKHYLHFKTYVQESNKIFKEINPNKSNYVQEAIEFINTLKR